MGDEGIASFMGQIEVDPSKVECIVIAMYMDAAYMGEFNPMGVEEAWVHALEQYTAAGMHWTFWTYRRCRRYWAYRASRSNRASRIYR